MLTRLGSLEDMLVKQQRSARLWALVTLVVGGVIGFLTDLLASVL